MLVTCCVSILCIAPALAQSRVDFSGTWTLDEKRSGSPSGENFVGPIVWVVDQTPKSVNLERRRGGDVDRFTYVLSEKAPSADSSVKSPIAEAPGHRGYWDGDRLLLETHQTIQGKTVTAREVLTLTPAGELVVERVVEVEHGYTMKGAQNFNAVKDVFTRSPQK